MRAALSSQPTTSAPPENSALAAIRPELPRPNTATFFPAKEVIGIMALARATSWRESGRSSPQFQSGEPGQREHDGDDPEPDHDLRLGPAELLEMMVDRGHPEHALSGNLERYHLHDHRDRFEHEQAADDAEH